MTRSVITDPDGHEQVPRRLLSTTALHKGVVAAAATAAGIGAAAMPAAASLGHRHVYYENNCATKGVDHIGQQLIFYGPGSASNYAGTAGGCNGEGYGRTQCKSGGGGTLDSSVHYGTTTSACNWSGDVTIYLHGKLRSTDASNHKLSDVSHWANT